MVRSMELQASSPVKMIEIPAGILDRAGHHSTQVVFHKTRSMWKRRLMDW